MDDALDEGQGGGTVEVLIPLGLDQAYSYAVPAGLALAPGDVVQVPLGPRETIGVVWERGSGRGGNLKKVAAKLDLPPLDPALMKLVDWVAWYTLAAKGSVLALALRRPPDDRPERPKLGVRLVGPPPARMTPARARTITAAEGGLLVGKSALAEAASVSAAVIDSLVDAGTFCVEALPQQAIAARPDPDHARPALSAGQQEVAGSLVAAVRSQAYSVALLEGVTGSGKTEVYFEAVAEAIRLGRQSLILMPEIALTAQFIDRFESRFGVRPGLWHSAVSGRRRERLQAAIAEGEALVVAGARSALFLPYRDLGLIIVDEEHEAAYKQEDGVAYHARDMAVVRGKIESAPVVLASATPSLETRVNAERGRYLHLRLPERFGGRQLPSLGLVDLRRDKPERGRWISGALIKAVEANLEAKEQSLLFLNRRGYAPLTLCRDCGHRFQCPNCSAWLVDHRFRRALVCHHCGHVERRPHECPSCHKPETLAACGPGVERLAEEVATLFPQARAIVLSSDFPGGTERLKQELMAVAEGEFDIVIGTQLVAKGHNFPGMTLVGVVDADLGLTSGDPRAAERTFQALRQVTGRAGRGEKPGRALLQTHDPAHPVLKALVSGDPERFYAAETAAREAAGLPPFGRLAALIVSANAQAEAENHARALARCAEAPAGVAVLGPAEAPLAILRGRHRMRLIVRTPREIDLQGYLRAWLKRAPRPKGSVRVAVDVDPQSFL
ncbi:primosomal protein N' [Bosea sp. (in: a-proteobacteria)]|uniref:primosomal protein N' n=1 Tax=Bosea sp. (in: a-proteobacteria) TaxID=1871050 RepID=UPI001AC4265B|nr:primosomal protein N' [Bosea sp. (in: a-proteobacteria)]MBN9436684.1 primosomal protein N' [Bosea sp. (in: a-proteobacteria)]